MTNLPSPYSNIKPINLDTEMSGKIIISAAPVKMGGIWSNYLSVVFTEKVLQMADISDDGWLD